MAISSGSADASTLEYLNGLNFTGGYPQAHDLAPSALFAAIYIVFLGVTIWRWVDPRSRTWLLLRPTIFVLARIGTYILRAIMAKHTYGEPELIAELVLVSVGFLLIISPIIDMWKRHVLSAIPKAQQPGWVTRLARIAQLVLIASIVTAIIGSTKIGSSTPLSTIKTLRKASYLLSLLVVVITLFAIVSTHFSFNLGRGGSALLAAVTVCCLVTAVYRVVQIFSTDPKDKVRSLAAFFVLQGTMEVFALIGVLAVRIPEWFPGEDERQKEVDAEMANLHQPAFTQQGRWPRSGLLGKL